MSASHNRVPEAAQAVNKVAPASSREADGASSEMGTQPKGADQKAPQNPVDPQQGDRIDPGMAREQRINPWDVIPPEPMAGLKKVPGHEAGVEEYNRAMKHLLGLGTKRDSASGMAMLQKAAEKGNPAAQEVLAVSYKNGVNIGKDLRKAFFWYNKAAESGSTTAMMALGYSYSRGDWLEKSAQKAFAWFESAAKRGNSDGQLMVGMCYSKGDGVQKDPKLAQFWFQRSADANNRIGQYYLAECYIHGQGVTPNAVKANYWLKRSADNGYEPALKALKGRKR